ncbi:MAG: hypothetical protein HQL39_14650, partial [Alphaproteobacteria bacterium]|nr:hypothetical protein [Alphaproteobacteria bacterium]
CWFAIDWFGPGGLGASLARELGVEAEEAIGLAARRFLEGGLRLHAAGGDVSGFLTARANRFLGIPNGPVTASRSEAESAAEAEAAPTPPRPPRADRGETAHIESPVFASDLRELLGSGRLLLGVWSRLGCSRVNSKRVSRNGSTRPAWTAFRGGGLAALLDRLASLLAEGDSAAAYALGLGSGPTMRRCGEPCQNHRSVRAAGPNAATA